MVEAPFESYASLQDAYRTTSTNDNYTGPSPQDGSGSSSGVLQWAAPQPVEQLSDGWSLFRAEGTKVTSTGRLVAGSKQVRWFVIRQTSDGQLQLITDDSANTETVTMDTQTADLPYHETEQKARDAYQSWQDANGDNSGGSENWSEWVKQKKVGDWTLYARQHQTKDKTQWALGGHDRDTDQDIWLWPKGKVKNKRYAFTSLKAVQKAFQAWKKRHQNGNAPEPEGPPQNPPSDAGGSGGPGAGGGLLATLTSSPLLLAGVLGGGYLLYQRSGLDPAVEDAGSGSGSGSSNTSSSGNGGN